jgi:lipoprotein-anchoring transpeptidase ErfK/SrfK
MAAWRVPVALALLCVVVGVTGCGRSASRLAAPAHAGSVSGPPANDGPPPTTTTTTAPLDPNATFVVATKGSIPAFAAPGAPANGTVPATWYGYPTLVPVIAQKPGWFEVRLAQRPNGSVAWVRDQDVTLALITTYRIVVSVAAQRLKLFQDGRLVLAFPAGVGTYNDPTVTGNFFIAIKAPPPNPGYGAFVLATSAHSSAITDWEGLGDAIIAIHGPIDAAADAQIGATGAHISHGCIRLHASDLAQLALVPVGTPVDIEA